MKDQGRHIKVSSTDPGDPEAVNKTQLRVIPDDSLMQEDNLVNLAVKWIDQNETGNAIVLFSKGRINNLVQKIIKRVAPENLTNISNRGPVNESKRQEIREFERNLKYKRFSPIEIQHQVDVYRRLNPEGDYGAYRRFLEKNPEDRSGGEIDTYTKYFISEKFPSTQAEIIERIKNKPGADQIKNPELREAVAYGVGYIYRSDEDDFTKEDRRMGKKGVDEDDKRIVAELFSHGKINVLLATPSIGVGVNVSIRNMYIPSILKYEGNGGFGGKIIENNKREMSQLLNRAGRGVTPISGIYVPKQFVPYIQDIISMGNMDHPVVKAIPIRIETGEHGVEVLKRMFHSASYKMYKDLNANYSGGDSVSRRFKDALRRFASDTSARMKHFIGSSGNLSQPGKRYEELTRKLRSLSQNVEHTLQSQTRMNQFSNEKERLDKFLPVLNKRTDILNELNKLLGEFREVSSQTPPSELKAKSMSREANVMDLIYRINLLNVDYVFDNYRLIVTKIDSIKSNPRPTWSDRSDLSELEKIFSRFPVYNSGQMRTRLDNQLNEVIRLISDNVDLLNAIRRTNNTGLSSYLRNMEPEFLKLRGTLIQYRDKLRDRITDVRDLPR